LASPNATSKNSTPALFLKMCFVAYQGFSLPSHFFADRRTRANFVALEFFARCRFIVGVILSRRASTIVMLRCRFHRAGFHFQ
jgi:hypothetical protein